MRSLVGDELFSRYDRLLLQSTLDLMSGVFLFCSSKSGLYGQLKPSYSPLFRIFGHLKLVVSLLVSPVTDVVYCPRRPCSSAVIREKSSTVALCSVCGFAFCVTCRKTYHGAEDCDTENQQREDDQEELANLPQTSGKFFF